MQINNTIVERGGGGVAYLHCDISPHPSRNFYNFKRENKKGEIFSELTSPGGKNTCEWSDFLRLKSNRTVLISQVKTWGHHVWR